MGLLLTQIREMEAGLDRLQRQIPDFPVLQIMTSRLLVLLGRELSTSVDQRLRPHGLTEIEFRTLTLVFSHCDRGAYPGELCAGLGHSPANVTRISDVLVERGLLTRVPDDQDRRRLVLRLTPQGDSLARTLIPLMQQSVRDSFHEFTTDDLEQLAQGLKKLAVVLDQAGQHSLCTDPQAAVKEATI